MTKQIKQAVQQSKYFHSGDYKPTYNKALDAVGACIRHYARLGVRVKTIYLSRTWWLEFVDGVKKMMPDYEIENCEVDFDDVIVKRGSILQSENIYWEVIKPKIKAEA